MSEQTNLTTVDSSKLPPRKAGAMMMAHRVRTALAAAGQFVDADEAAKDIDPEAAQYARDMLANFDRQMLRDIFELSGTELPAGARPVGAVVVPESPAGL